MPTETAVPPALTPEEEAFLARARACEAENLDWFAFESFAFGMQSPIFSKSRSHHGPHVENPVYIALREMWLRLGIRQGWVGESATLRPEPLPH
jgi:hypothetical protein